MCMVSVVTGYFQQQPFPSWNEVTLRQAQELQRQAEEYDKKTGQPDCAHDETKDILKRIEERLTELEEETKQISRRVKRGPRFVG